MTDASETLTLHVLGGDEGESLILQMPGNRWGVIDCYSPSLTDPQNNPTLQLLLQEQVEGLEFLGLTHAHRDHYRGMSHLLRHFAGHILFFWRFAGHPLEEILSYVYLETSPSGAAISEDAEELRTIFRLVERARRDPQDPLRVKHFSDYKPLYPHPLGSPAPTHRPQVEIFSLAPPSGQVQRFEVALRQSLDADLRFRPEALRPRHNWVSGVLLVVYGRTALILGGDAEEESWTETLVNLEVSILAAQGVKASHHASEQGMREAAWAAFSRINPPVVIITPFRRQGLPTAQGLARIQRYTDRILTTCVATMPTTDARGTGAWENFPPLVRLALRPLFRTPQRRSERTCGRCSLTFDAEGQCLARQVSGAAGEYPLDQTDSFGISSP